MKRKRKENKRPRYYRQDYERYLGYRISWDYDVHHIDGNVWNNEISNLVAIPKDLHDAYHTAKDRNEDVSKIQSQIMQYKASQDFCR